MLLRLLGGLPGALKRLRALIDAEALPVKKNVVRGERDLEQIVAEVEAARASAPGAEAAAGRHANCGGRAENRVCLRRRRERGRMEYPLTCACTRVLDTHTHQYSRRPRGLMAVRPRTTTKEEHSTYSIALGTTFESSRTARRWLTPSDETRIWYHIKPATHAYK